MPVIFSNFVVLYELHTIASIDIVEIWSSASEIEETDSPTISTDSASEVDAVSGKPDSTLIFPAALFNVVCATRRRPLIMWAPVPPGGVSLVCGEPLRVLVLPVGPRTSSAPMIGEISLVW